MTDNSWRPGASLESLQQRAQTLQHIRRFFAQRKILEVQTPVITEYGVTDIHIGSFALQDHTGYLRTSPEYAHKRLLAAGYGDIYELGPVFRQGESGRWHNPEFTMLEWYRVGWNYRKLADEVIELLQAISPMLVGEWPVEKHTYAELAFALTGLDIHNTATAELAALAQRHGWDSGSEQPRSSLLDYIFSHLIQPQLKQQCITLIYDFPACQAALAQCRAVEHGSKVAERFELFLGSIELANGFQELTETDELIDRFTLDQQQRQLSGLPFMPLDTQFLKAMKHGLPESSGVAMGIDRTISILSGSNQIASSLTF